MNTCTTIVKIAIVAAAACAATAQDAAQPPVSPVEGYVQQLSEDPQSVLAATEQARDAALALWPGAGNDQLVDAVEHHAIARLAAELSQGDRQALAGLWESHPTFVGVLARVYTSANNPSRVIELAGGIAVEHPESMEKYPQLAAAICVVLDRPHAFPGLGQVMSAGVEVFEGLVYAFEDRRVMALPMDELPAEVLAYKTDIALTGDGIDQTAEDRRAVDPLELYQSVPYREAGLLAGEAAPSPADLTFEKIVERGGVGPIRSFYAEQLGQIFGWPVAIATGKMGDDRFAAPVFLEEQRRRYAWNLEALPDNPGVALGMSQHPITHEPISLAELVVSADLANGGAPATRTAWAFLEAAEATQTPSMRQALIKAAWDQTKGFAGTWSTVLAMRLEEAGDEPTGPQRVLTEFFDQTEDVSPMFATQVALEAIAGLEDRHAELLDWVSLRSRRNPNRYVAAQLAIGDAALASGNRAAAQKVYEDLLARQADATPLALDALARLEAMARQDGDVEEVIDLYTRLHRRLRAPRSDAAGIRASAFMLVGSRLAEMLRDEGRTREAERLDQRLARELR